MTGPRRLQVLAYPDRATPMWPLTMEELMTNLVPRQWLTAETVGFDRLFALSIKSIEAFERLVALNLQAARFGLAESQEILTRTLAAENLPELLSLPALLSPVGGAQALSYSRQFYEIISDMRREYIQPEQGRSKGQPHLAAGLLGSLGTQALVPDDTLAASSAVSPVPASATTASTKQPAGKSGKRAIRAIPVE